MTNPKKIVITGGPGAGKTTAIDALKNRLDLYLVPEAATMLLESSYPTTSPEQPWTPTWQQGLQIAVMGLQKGLELLARENAGDSRAIIYDRGIADNAAYLGSVAEYEKLGGESLAETLKRYDAVIFMHSLAKLKDYKQYSNPARFETESQAIETNDTLYEIWRQHPNCIEVDSLTERSRIVESLVNRIVATAQ